MWQRLSQSWSGPGDRRDAGLSGQLLSSGEFRRQVFRQAGTGEDKVDEAAIGVDRSQKLDRLEAALLVAPSAMSPRRLADVAKLASPDEAGQLVERLNRIYDVGKSAFYVARVATRFELRTRPEFSFWLDRLHNRQDQLKLSTQALETLTIVAYRQPVTRADIKAIRGVDPTDTLRHLMERGLVRIGGVDVGLGRPILYKTTRTFLELFGFQDLAELPDREKLRESPKIAASAPDDDESGQAADDLVENGKDEDLDEDDELDADDDLDADEELDQENW